MTTTMATARGIHLLSLATKGWSRAATVVAATTQPMTRVALAISRSAARVAPKRTTARMSERGVNRRRSMDRSSAIRSYSTDVPDEVPLLRPPSPEPRVRVVDLDWHSVLIVLAAFVALVGVTGVVRSAPNTITNVIIGTLLALALNPAVTAVETKLGGHRALSVVIVLVSITVAITGLMALLSRPAIDQARELPSQAPRVVRQLTDLPVIGPRLEKANADVKVQQWIEDLPDRLQRDSSRIARTGGVLIDGFVSGALTILVAIALLLDGERLVNRLNFLIPHPRRAQAGRAAHLAYGVVGRYVAGSLLI